MNQWVYRSVAAVLVTLFLVGAAGCRTATEPASPATGAAAGTPAVLTVDAAAAGSDAGSVGARVAVSGMRFAPEIVRVKPGQAVIWEFDDPGIVHSVTAFDGSFDSGLRSDGTFAVRFDTPGTYCFQCLPHPGRNLCEQGSVVPSDRLVLAGSTVRLIDPIRSLLGGGHMQGKVIVAD